MRNNPNLASVLYNGMIAPVAPYGIRGAIWYQGEANTGRAKQYQKLFAMEGVGLEFREGVLQAIAKKALVRKAGARGLRSIMEHALLDTMFDLPGLDGVEQVVIGPEVVEGNARPLYIYAERADRAERAS